MKRSPVRILAATLATLVCVALPALAQIDIAGEWQSRVHEDQPHRGLGAELGDYTGLPIFMRGPGPQMRIKKVDDPTTQALIGYTLEGVFGRDDRVIPDGRTSASAESAEHTLRSLDMNSQRCK